MPQIASCTYNPTNVQNLTVISQKLLSIINTTIISLPTQPPLPPTSVATPFDCSEWEKIKQLLISYADTTILPPGILDNLYTTIGHILDDTTVCNLNYGYAAQLERLKCIIDSIRIRLTSVACNSYCSDIVGDLLCFLMGLLTQLITVVAKLSTLTYFACCTDKISVSFFNCLVCEFINDICNLESMVPELSALVVSFASCDSNQVCTPCYTASCAPKKVRRVNSCVKTTYVPYVHPTNCGCDNYNDCDCGCNCDN
ncbi:MAG: hypothetical protein ACRC3Y_13805 [Romboutsia sp.]|uniref:hypothetical protein n=1 Tax=Romboutsia sp. TaxID=1965302 RepID=UPI003F3BF431